MTEGEINVFVDYIEKLWLENSIAKKYLKNTCGILNPTEFFNEEISKIPKDDLVYRVFAPVRQKIGQGLQDTASFESLPKVILESLKHKMD